MPPQQKSAWNYACSMKITKKIIIGKHVTLIIKVDDILLIYLFEVLLSLNIKQYKENKREWPSQLLQ